MWKIAFLFILVAAFVFGTSDVCTREGCSEEDEIVPDNIYDSKIKEAIKNLINCIDSKVLDLKEPLNLSTDLIKLNLMLKHLSIEELGSINLDDLKMLNKKDHFDLSLYISFEKSLRVKALYNIDSTLGDDMLHIFGEGYFEAEFSNLQLKIDAVIGTIVPGKLVLVNPLRVRSFVVQRIDPKKEEFKFKITGLMNDDLTSEVFSKYLPNTIEETFQDFGKEIYDFLTKTLGSIVSSAIYEKKLSDLMKIKAPTCDELLSIFNMF